MNIREQKHTQLLKAMECRTIWPEQRPEHSSVFEFAHKLKQTHKGLRRQE